MIEALFVSGCFLAFLSNADGLGPIARPLIFLTLFLAAVLAVLTDKMQRIAASPAELLLYFIGLLSAAVSLVRSEEYCIYYTMYFISALIFMSVFARSLPLERLLDLGAYVVILCIAACVFFQRGALVAALELSVGRSGLERFSPFNDHPLLIGYIFGSGSLLLARRVYLARSILERSLMAGAVLLAWTIVVAASSRSSIVALMVATLFAVLFEFRALRAITVKRAAVAAGALVALSVLYFGFAGTYLVKILEIDSTYRGFGTGATGRTDLWAKAVQSLVSDPMLIAFGGGLRSSEYTVIGFLTENSYLTILLDSGLMAGGTLILFLLYTPINALRMQRSAPPEPKRAILLLPSFFVFLLVQCFFLRYFIGLGNPTSLLTLAFFLSLSMYPRFGTRPASAPDRPADTQPAMSALTRMKS